MTWNEEKKNINRNGLRDILNKLAAAQQKKPPGNGRRRKVSAKLAIKPCSFGRRRCNSILIKDIDHYGIKIKSFDLSIAPPDSEMGRGKTTIIIHTLT